MKNHLMEYKEQAINTPQDQDWREGNAARQDPKRAIKDYLQPTSQQIEPPQQTVLPTTEKNSTPISLGDWQLQEEQNVLEERLVGLDTTEEQQTGIQEEESPPFPYEAINWEQVGKREYFLKAGEAISIYKIARTMGWPPTKATDAHIINYIRKSAALASITVVDNKHLQVTSNRKLFIPEFQAYRQYIEQQGKKDARFQQFYQEHLKQHDYPALITVPEAALYNVTVDYTNPISDIRRVVPVVETFYGQWYLAHLASAKEFYDRHQTIRGFRYELLDGVPEPVHTEITLDMGEEYKAYDKKEWQKLPWQERVEYFDKGLDRRLEEDRGILRAFYKETVRKNGGVDDSGILAHTAKGKEVYGGWEKTILLWEEDGINRAGDALGAANMAREESEDAKKEGQNLKAQAYSQEQEAYTLISPIIKRWENPDHQPTKEEIAQLQVYREFLQTTQLGFFHPEIGDLNAAISQINHYLLDQLPYAALDGVGEDNTYRAEEEQKYQTLWSLLLQSKEITRQHTSQGTIPNYEEFLILRQTKQLMGQQPLGIQLKWTKFIYSANRGDYLINKYGSTKTWTMPENIQFAKEQKSKTWSNRNE